MRRVRRGGGRGVSVRVKVWSRVSWRGSVEDAHGRRQKAEEKLMQWGGKKRSIGCEMSGRMEVGRSYSDSAYEPRRWRDAKIDLGAIVCIIAQRHGYRAGPSVTRIPRRWVAASLPLSHCHGSSMPRQHGFYPKMRLSSCVSRPWVKSKPSFNLMSEGLKECRGRNMQASLKTGSNSTVRNISNCVAHEYVLFQCKSSQANEILQYFYFNNDLIYSLSHYFLCSAISSSLSL